MVDWTEITRRQYRRDDLAYASDLRDQPTIKIGNEGERKVRFRMHQRRKPTPAFNPRINIMPSTPNNNSTLL